MTKREWLLPAFHDVLCDAEQLVRQKPLWSKFIKGTPLENDVPVMMADFALRLLQRGSPAPTADLRAALLRIRAGIAADRCDGESEWANGVNSACKNHLAFVDAVLAEAGVNAADGGQR